MSDHFELTLQEFLADIAEDEAALRDKKRAVNAVCAMKGRAPAFADVELETVAATTGKLLGDEFYAKKQHSACRMILERRKALNLGPATVDDFFRDLVAGGYAFAAKTDEIAMRGLGQMLSQNTSVFIRLPNGKFSLREWYPNARKQLDKSTDAAADGQASGSRDEEAIDSK